MGALILLPNFIKFFGEAKDGTTSPGRLAAIFMAFSKFVITSFLIVVTNVPLQLIDLSTACSS